MASLYQMRLSIFSSMAYTKRSLKNLKSISTLIIGRRGYSCNRLIWMKFKAISNSQLRRDMALSRTFRKAKFSVKYQRSTVVTGQRQSSRSSTEIVQRFWRLSFRSSWYLILSLRSIWKDTTSPSMMTTSRYLLP